MVVKNLQCDVSIFDKYLNKKLTLVKTYACKKTYSCKKNLQCAAAIFDLGKE
jgi:hypothetical protein